MNREWSEKNKKMQALLKKGTFSEGINELIGLRDLLFTEILSWRDELTNNDFSKMPYINADGYHSKSIAYSIWHIMRIEDIVLNTLIRNREEVLFSEGFDTSIHSPIITTGNELVKEEIMEFSEKLELSELYRYAEAVKRQTDEWLLKLSYEDLATAFSNTDRERLLEKKVVSSSELAAWLIDYWCEKDIKGLIKMPFSRHWIMHVEAANRIKTKLKK